MAKERVHISHIRAGDIINVVNPATGKTFPALVLEQIHDPENTRKIQALDIFEIERVPKSAELVSDTYHQIVDWADDLRDLGLENRANYRVKFSPLRMPVKQEFTGIDRTNHVEKLGSVAFTTAFDKVLRHADSLHRSGQLYSPLAQDLPPALTRGAQRDYSRFQTELRTGWRKQGGFLPGPTDESTESSVRTNVRPMPSDDRPRKRRKSSGRGEAGRKADIDLKNAWQAELISEDIYAILTRKPRGPGRKKTLTTLREAFDLANQDPDKLARYLPQSTQKPDFTQITLKQIYDEGLISEFTFNTLTKESRPGTNARNLENLAQAKDLVETRPETLQNYAFVGKAMAKRIVADINAACGEISKRHEPEITADTLKNRIRKAWTQFTQDVANSNTTKDPRYKDPQTGKPFQVFRKG